MTNRDRILNEIRNAATGLSDRELCERTGIQPHQQVNQICRALAEQGLVRRGPRDDGIIVNVSLTGRSQPANDAADVRQSLPKAAKATARGGVDVDSSSTLFVVTCSARKSQGGSPRLQSRSIVDVLPSALGEELTRARTAIASAANVDEGLVMAARDRYRGHQYHAAGSAFADAESVGATTAIVSGGYGVVLAEEPIGWYDRQFRPGTWPRRLVERVLASLAASVGATDVVAFAGSSTQYAAAMKRVSWPRSIRTAQLVSIVDIRGGAQIAVPMALGEAFREVVTAGSITTDWRSQRGLGVRLERLV
ncbi:MAG: hypothetical protein JWO36_6948 [Myxococcales bacterium]|nr:hypothetical protein [Myxococcales bacterium]